MKKKITLHAWAKPKFDPVPSNKTLQRWARECWILPLPQKIGKHWLVDEDAEYVGPNAMAVIHESQAA